MLKWDGSSIKPAGRGSYAVSHMWGTAANDVYAATVFGSGVFHYDGTNWTEEATTNSQPIYGISGAGGHVWAVGAGASILMR